MRLVTQLQVVSQATQKNDFGMFQTDISETQQVKLADGSVRETMQIHQVLSRIELKPGLHVVAATFKVSKMNRLSITIQSLAESPKSPGGKATA